MRRAVLLSGFRHCAGIRKAMMKGYSGCPLKLGLLGLLLLILLGGCVNMGKTKQSASAAAREYLEQRYGGTFTYSEPWGSFYTNGGTARMLFTSSELNADIYVEAQQKEGEYTFQDNYLAVKYQQQMADAIQAVADDCFGSAKVFYELLIQPVSPELGPDASFQEYSADVSSGAAGTVVVSAEGFDESQADLFADELSKAGLGAFLRFAAVDETQYEGIDLAGLEKIIDTDAVQFFKVLDVYASDAVSGS